MRTVSSLPSRVHGGGGDNVITSGAAHGFSFSPLREPVRPGGRAKVHAASVSFPEPPRPGAAHGRAGAIGAPCLFAPRGTAAAPGAFLDHDFPRHRGDWRSVRAAGPPWESECDRAGPLRTPLAGGFV